MRSDMNAGNPPGRGSDDTLGTPRKGVRLGVDVGTVRVGVAISDPNGVLATPVATLARDPAGDTDLAALAALVEEHEVVEVVVGLPKTLRGADGPAVIAARAYGASLAARIAPVPLVFVDERLTTVSADRQLSQAGVRGRARRKVIDQVAATRILQNRLDNLSGGAR
jgi:putative Holliday junction resolvase